MKKPIDYFPVLIEYSKDDMGYIATCPLPDMKRLSAWGKDRNQALQEFNIVLQLWEES
jgi:predicted RNase H-like HicB family nuclease